MDGSMIDHGTLTVPPLSYDDVFWFSDPKICGEGHPYGCALHKTRVRPSVLSSAWAHGGHAAMILVNTLLGDALAADDPTTPNVNETTGVVTLELPTRYADTEYPPTEPVRVFRNDEVPIYMTLAQAQTQTLSPLDVVMVEIGVSPPDPGDCCLPPVDEECVVFGDADGSGGPDVVDVQCNILIALFQLKIDSDAPPPQCAAGPMESSDLDCDGSVTVTDVILTVRAALDVGLSPDIDSDGDGCPDACAVSGG